MKDLFVLVADADMAETLRAVLDRPKSLGIRPIQHEVDRHLGRDPGCCTTASRRLRPYLSQYRKALVIFDKDGCGREGDSRERIQMGVEQDLAATDGLVIEPKQS